MAKLLFTAFLADARGKVNGTVFSKNRGGAYARTKVTPSNPQTSYQSAVRQRLAGLAAAFRALLAAQILAWNVAVNDFPVSNIFGNTIHLTGLQLYVRLNANLEGIGQPQISDPPLPVGFSFLDPAINTMSNVAFTLDLSAATVAEWYSIEATPPVSPGKFFVKNLYRVITNVQGTGAAIVASNIFAAYSAKFGSPVSGQRISVRVALVNGVTGQKSVPVNFNAIVA